MLAEIKKGRDLLGWVGVPDLTHVYQVTGERTARYNDGRCGDAMGGWPELMNNFSKKSQQLVIAEYTNGSSQFKYLQDVDDVDVAYV